MPDKEFLGANITEEAKSALRNEAVLRQVSMSKLTSDILTTMLVECGHDLDGPDPDSPDDDDDEGDH